MTFDTILMVDWSGGNDRGATPKKDAIWTCIAGAEPIYHRNRSLAEAYLLEALSEELAAGRRVLAGFDLCFAYPDGFAEPLTGNDDPLALWDWFEARVSDSPDRNNRFHLAAEINAQFPGTGPFWFNALKEDIAHLPRKGMSREGHGLPEFRTTDEGAFSPWQLSGAGAVGGQVIMGLPTLSRLRQSYKDDLRVWPFETPDAPIVLAETYFSLLRELPLDSHDIKDAAQVKEYAELFASLNDEDWQELLKRPRPKTGWVLGRGNEDRLGTYIKPKLKNDCFALPQGVYWTPVDDALAHLQNKLRPAVRSEVVKTIKASGRILAEDALAKRSHPPTPNAAVDGYGFAGPLPNGPSILPLETGRAAPGAPHLEPVPKGKALRILTGAALPEGVNTIVLQEDVEVFGHQLRLNGSLKLGANTRAAGEDIVAKEVVLRSGHKLTPADIGTLTATGVDTVRAMKALRVGVLSTGDELRNTDEPATPDQIFDANRPMLLDIIRRWQMDPVDLGRAPDDREILKRRLTEAAQTCDVILTSGGASGGDEDHMSALLKDTGSFALWRIAVKPGRPLAFGLWDDTPVIALPGNPVAAFVCTLVFGRPALTTLAGGNWSAPTGFMVPAGFAMSKKAGRREFLRARIEDGKVERFVSEGSGRISGLSWAKGLVELPDEAMNIAKGDPVRFIPFGSFGL